MARLAGPSPTKTHRIGDEPCYVAPSIEERPMATLREQDESRFTGNPTNHVVGSHPDDVAPSTMGCSQVAGLGLRATRRG